MVSESHLFNESFNLIAMKLPWSIKPSQSTNYTDYFVTDILKHNHIEFGQEYFVILACRLCIPFLNYDRQKNSNELKGL